MEEHSALTSKVRVDSVLEHSKKQTWARTTWKPLCWNKGLRKLSGKEEVIQSRQSASLGEEIPGKGFGHTLERQLTGSPCRTTLVETALMCQQEFFLVHHPVKPVPRAREKVSILLSPAHVHTLRHTPQRKSKLLRLRALAPHPEVPGCSFLFLSPVSGSNRFWSWRTPTGLLEIASSPGRPGLRKTP